MRTPPLQPLKRISSADYLAAGEIGELANRVGVFDKGCLTEGPLGIVANNHKGRLRWCAVLLLLLLAATGVCAAHPANVPSAQLKVQTSGAVEMHLRFDILAFLLEETPQEITDGPMNALLDGPQTVLQDRLNAGTVRLRNEISILGDNGPATLGAIKFPGVAEVLECAAENGKQRLPVMLTVIIPAHLAPGAKTVACRFPEVLGSVVLTTEMPYEEPVSEPVEPGDTSSPLQIPTDVQVATIAATMHTAAGKTTDDAKLRILHATSESSNRQSKIEQSPAVTAATRRLASQVLLALTKSFTVGGNVPPTANSIAQQPDSSKPAPAIQPVLASRTAEQIEPSPQTQQAPSPPLQSPIGRPAWYVMFGKYIKMGYKHILPQGLDHILFVLGLFLLSRSTKALLTQISAFTIAHSITLGLSLYGVFQLPPSIVEPLIALSIVFVAVENLYTTEMKPWRPFVVFGFGLVHGLGFAGALKQAGLAHGDFLTGLVGFNAGVELGQLSVVALAFLLVGWYRSNPRYRPNVIIPGSALIAAVALFWTIQRIS